MELLTDLFLIYVGLKEWKKYKCMIIGDMHLASTAAILPVCYSKKGKKILSHKYNKDEALKRLAKLGRSRR